MAVLVYHIFAFFSLSSYGLYHLISATRAHLKHPSPPSSSSSSSAPRGAGDHFAHPYYPLPLPPHRHHLLRHLPLYLAAISLLIAIAHYAFLSPAAADGRSPVHRLATLQSAAALLLFLLLAAAALLLPHPLPPDLLFLLASLAFALLTAASAHSAAAYQTIDLQAKCDSLSAAASAASAAACLALALNPGLFPAELALAGSIVLQGLWSLQSGLSLYVDAFIPDGCHRLLDVPAGSATRCDLEDSRLRAAAILDLAFVLHATLVAAVAVLVYAAVSRASVAGGGLGRRHNGGSYEALPTSSTGALGDLDLVQMKQLAKNSTQA
ncbi:uncharacterized protein [Elaeis guineensis]|uniref:Uncharacterized protein LOC105050971 n=1 Tax=Elaeis guineensis var. tenera TaxID=51953 RepID=A0A6J0PM66_ELAGV|nr:uncharacterized protein LOC105050971 [Elaeis guineensis]XP_019708193.1 uncharacterized protein LOC105050971 [Elaeis guineensis]XP_029122243.1 uncharacterized protein LOC105050971 [Elaeis guineensis]